MKTVSPHERLKAVLPLLDQLQATNGREAYLERAELSKRIMAAIDIPAAEIARRLNVSKLSVERWALGVGPDPERPKGNAPRTSQIEDLRALVQLEMQNLGKAKLPLTPFGRYSIGLYRAVEHFFERAVDSEDDTLCVDKVYVFKSLMGFHGGTQAETRESLRVLLEEHPKLEVHYVYPSRFDQSETVAQRTFTLMKKHPSLTNVQGRIIEHPLDPEDPKKTGHLELMARLGLGYTYCSAFVLIYNNEGKKRFDRNLDILLEVPCQRYDLATGRPVDAEGPEFVFVELPQNMAPDLWTTWEAALAELFKTETQ